MRCCVIIPTYDTPRTLEAVVRGALAFCPDVLVVDDGSRVPAAELLGAVPAAVVLRHERNRGKGAALATGLAEAERRGFTHAVTLDSDGQHLPEDIPRFLEAIARNPEAVILGARDLLAGGAGRRSRLGRVNSNFWTWVATGRHLADTQTGFRAYPLAQVNALLLRSTGYDFEIEVLVKAAWAGVAIESLPIGVRYFEGEARVSHFRPFLDFLKVARLNARLIALRICLPAPYLGTLCLRKFRSLPWTRRLKETVLELFVREPGTSGRIACSVGLGVFMGLVPAWGFQTALALLSAHVLGMSKPITVLASNISFPLVIPFILYASLVLGRLALGTSAGMPSVATLELAKADLPAWIVGSFILAALGALAGTAIAYVSVAGLRRARRRKADA